MRRSAQAELIQASFEALGELQPEEGRGQLKRTPQAATRPRQPRQAASSAAASRAAHLAEQLLTSPTLNRRQPKRIARVYEVKPTPERSLTFAAGTGPTISYVGVHYRAADLPVAMMRSCAPIACRAVAMPRPSGKRSASSSRLPAQSGRRAADQRARDANIDGRWCRKCRWPRRRCVMTGRHAMPLPTLLPRRHRDQNPLRIDASLRVHDEKGRLWHRCPHPSARADSGAGLRRRSL